MRQIHSTLTQEMNIMVSVIVPVRNEEKYIAECMESILSQSYPKEDLEVLLVDGQSEDNTRKIISSYCERYPYIRLLDNPYRTAPRALNTGIKASRGNIIIRLDAHTYYDKDYIARCVETLNDEKIDACNVGGPIVTLPGDGTLTAKAIALATSHPFGVGNSKFRTSCEPRYVDTVPFGAFKREIFDEVGLFNEYLLRNQDVELNSRIRKSGKRIYLSPGIKSFYYNRPDLKALWRQNFNNGMWNIFTNALSKGSLSIRHFIPLIFVLSLIGSALMILINPAGYLLTAFVLISYLAANIFFSLKICRRNGLKLLPALVLSFAALHFSYGLGSVWGLVRVRGWTRALESGTRCVKSS